MGGLGVSVLARQKPTERLLSYLKAKSIRLPVMSLVYSASLLAKEHDVSVVDAANLDLDPEETLQKIEEIKPDWILSTTSIASLFQEANFLSHLKKHINVTTVLMGDAATFFSSKILEDFSIDFIVKGDEPEIIVEQLCLEKDPQNIKGLVYRKNNQTIDTGDPAMIGDLNTLPFPRWDLFPMRAYRYFPILRKIPFATILSTRGCPYGCIYCPYTSNQGLKYRFRSAQNVLDELLYLKEKFNIRSVQFRDPTFTLKKDRTLEICKGMVENKLDLEWGCETRLDCLDESLIEKMAEAGCKGVNVGIESSSPDVIKNVKRGWIDPNHIQKMVERMIQNKIRVSGFFIIGLPGENRKSVEDTLKFAVQIPLSYAEFKIATPFPGTPLFEMAKKNGWINEVKVEEYTSYTPSMRMSEELDPLYLKEAANRAYFSFYMRPQKIFREIFSTSFLQGLART